MKDGLLNIKNLRAYYRTPEGLVRAVDGTSLKIERGDRVGIAGESGSGKSTLALSILSLIPKKSAVVEGEILYLGKDLLRFSDNEMRDIQGKEIAIIFQEPMTSLNPFLKISTQLVDPMREHGIAGKKDAYKIAAHLLELVKITDPRGTLNRYPHELSGGMRQRVMIALALSCNPKLLIADEPTSALDTVTQYHFVKLLEKLQRELNMALMMISHNLYLIAETCDKVAIMYAGNIVEFASTRTIFKRPKHPYTKGLLESIPKFGIRGELKAIKGDVVDLLELPAGCPFYPRCGSAEKICNESRPCLREIAPGHFISCHAGDYD